MTDASVIKAAGRLTKAQREALLAATRVQAGHYPERWEVSTPRVWKSLIDKGLGYGATGAVIFRNHRPPNRCVLNTAGLAIRAHLANRDAE